MTPGVSVRLWNMGKIKSLMNLLLLLILVLEEYEAVKLRIFRIGDENNLGTGADTDTNAEDYILLKPGAGLNKPLLRKLSFCFNMFYLTLD